MEQKIVRRAVLVVFVGGIAGMIAGSIADNNGIAITFGLVTTVAAICLMLVTSVTSPGRTVAFDETTAEAMELRIQRLIDDGADERRVRDLVRDAVRLGRSARRIDDTDTSDPTGNRSTGTGAGRES